MKNTQVYLYIIVAALALSACAKRDSEFAARKNAAGATYVNDAQAAAADRAAEASGYKTEITSIQAPVQSGNSLSVSSVIKVNEKSYQVITTHSKVGAISATNATFDGANFEVSGVCGSDICSPYYLVINITRNGQRIKQTAMKKYFFYVNESSSQDLVMSLGASEFLSVQDAINTLDQAVVQ